MNFQVEQVAANTAFLIVQISDDGGGLAAPYREGVGLRSMRERAEEIGGRLTIESGQTQGTRVTAWLPLSFLLVKGSSYDLNPIDDCR